MKWRVGYDSTQRVVADRTIDLKTAKFRISRQRLRRIALGFLPFCALSVVCEYLDQTAMAWIGLAWGTAAALWQLGFYGLAATPSDDKALDATAIYGKRTLIFVGAFWALLISTVAFVLYLKATCPSWLPDLPGFCVL